jgi:hypothetical protein
MSHTIVSFQRFCEWVQGRRVVEEHDVKHRTVLTFEDGSEAVVYSEYDVRFGEKSTIPPIVSVREKSP